MSAVQPIATPSTSETLAELSARLERLEALVEALRVDTQELNLHIDHRWLLG